jgi:hypothetical protein
MTEVNNIKKKSRDVKKTKKTKTHKNTKKIQKKSVLVKKTNHKKTYKKRGGVRNPIISDTITENEIELDDNSSQHMSVDQLSHLVRDYIDIIDTFLLSENSKTTQTYTKHKDLFDFYETNRDKLLAELDTAKISGEEAVGDRENSGERRSKEFIKETDESFIKLQELVYIIIQDTMSTNVNNVGWVKTLEQLLKGMKTSFANDIEYDDDVKIIYRKRMTNNKPYLEVIHSKNGNETVYDVDELFALLRSEINPSKKVDREKTVLKKMNISNHFGVEKST